MADENQPQKSGGYGYGKRSMWQWAVLYLVVGGIVYFLVYWFFIRGGSGGGSLY